MISEHDARQLADRFDELEGSYARKYGLGSQARAFFLMEELVTMRFALLEAHPDAAPVLERQRRSTALKLQSLYDASPFPDGPAPPVRRPPGDAGVIEFDREVFAEKYAAAAELIQCDVVVLENWKPESQSRPTAYMYVVDEDFKMRVWVRQFRMSDLVLGRNRATVSGVPVAHPMLVPERLRVRAAGEITPIFGDQITGVVANLKSGHFRPSPEAALSVRRACAESLGLAAESCDVLTVPDVPGNSPQ
ncbi:hypothetical protein ACFXDE_34470 [Kitasatospora sp. NPDC059408]|uniref:hypothetical protein n=1 Tax=Kitasatospora sp. NPDC059408 TaxID=3346823 RepID=UPI0036BE8D43